MFAADMMEVIKWFHYGNVMAVSATPWFKEFLAIKKSSLVS